MAAVPSSSGCYSVCNLNFEFLLSKLCLGSNVELKPHFSKSGPRVALPTRRKRSFCRQNVKLPISRCSLGFDPRLYLTASLSWNNNSILGGQNPIARRRWGGKTLNFVPGDEAYFHGSTSVANHGRLMQLIRGLDPLVFHTPIRSIQNSEGGTC